MEWRGSGAAARPLVSRALFFHRRLGADESFPLPAFHSNLSEDGNFKVVW